MNNAIARLDHSLSVDLHFWKQRVKVHGKSIWGPKHLKTPKRAELASTIYLQPAFPTQFHSRSLWTTTDIRPQEIPHKHAELSLPHQFPPHPPSPQPPGCMALVSMLEASTVASTSIELNVIIRASKFHDVLFIFLDFLLFVIASKIISNGLWKTVLKDRFATSIWGSN